MKKPGKLSNKEMCESEATELKVVHTGTDKNMRLGK